MIALLLLLPTAAPAAARPNGQLAHTAVEFTSVDGVTLHGELIAPQGANGAPGLAMVGGAGPVTMDELRPAAEAFAAHGIPTLIWDKRTAGYSTLRRDYDRLADDALAAAQLLRSRPEIDPNRVGLWGLSEGAWVATLAAGRTPSDVSFVLTAGAVGLTPARQQAWAYGEFLRHAGITGSLVPTMQSTLIRQLAAAGLFPEADYDPVPAWERIHQPVLAEWGTLDREAVPAESERIVREALDRAGNRHYTIRTVPDVRHNLRRSFADGFDRSPQLPDDYADFESRWINGLASGLPAASADTAPAQEYASRPLAPLHWYEPPWLQAALTGVCLIGFVGHLATGTVRRLRRRPAPAGLPRPARWAALTGTLTVVGTPLYLLFMAITAASLPGPVLLGRPAVWWLLQLAAVATVVAVALTAFTALRNRPAGGARVRLGLLTLSGAAFVPWALYWGLLRP
ncbi:alpha/beta hydrolase family protein [Kitasatospora sp. CB01950]|uniref:alpha/beta hydrolase family protein n=1 Tax=Kitasatospora sp. CB01950 TaxID=1703930 RepID=UPI0018E93714|nr:prolyl oligopeptidase family serine peptidase [Kitasatospora sp. CB01950]